MLHVANYSEFELYLPDEQFESIASNIEAFLPVWPLPLKAYYQPNEWIQSLQPAYWMNARPINNDRTQSINWKSPRPNENVRREWGN